MKRLSVSSATLLLLLALFGGCASLKAGWYFETTNSPYFARAFDKTKDGVVFVRVRREAFNKKGKEINAADRKVSGAGVIIISRKIQSGGYELLILTNNHVIKDAQEITAYLFPGDKSYPVDIVGFDDFLDLALLRVKTPQKAAALDIGDPRKLKIGEPVYAIGHPYGWTWSIFTGTISNLWKDYLVETIQFDGTFGPGNSGGGLFNLAGELIGIPTSYLRNDDRIGFAISIHVAQKLLPALMKGGRVPHGSFGNLKFTGIGDLVPESEDIVLRALPSPYEGGVLITSVPDNSPGKKAGLLHGDIVVEVNGKAATNSRLFKKLFADSAVGTPIPIKVIRRGKEIALTIVPVEREEE